MATIDKIRAALAGGSSLAVVRDVIAPVLASVWIIGALVILGGGR